MIQNNDLACLNGANTFSYVFIDVVTSTKDPSKQDSVTYTVLLKNPCIEPSRYSLSVPEVQDQTYIVYSPQVEFMYMESVPTASTLLQNICGDIVYFVTYDGVNIASDTKPVKETTSSFTLCLFSDLPSDVATTGTLRVEASLVDHPTT